jgi:hypothetical protein
LRGEWLDPDAGNVPLGDYADRWVRERDLKALTREEYERHLRLHVRPHLGKVALNRDHTSTGPHLTWAIENGVDQSTVAKTAGHLRNSHR